MGRPKGSKNAPRAAQTATAKATATAIFSKKLALFRHLLGVVGAESFDDLRAQLHRIDEGYDAEGVSHFCRALLTANPGERDLSDEQLLQYDSLIAAHTARINSSRQRYGQRPVQWKYFQYLTLLFVEIYLDRYFGDPEALRAGINEAIQEVNDEVEAELALLDTAQPAGPQLNKLAIWCATGSGKTLLMHMNILQFRHYLQEAGRERELNRTLLVTPNEALSRQHLEADDGLRTAGFDADRFLKTGGSQLLRGRVEVIEVTKLGTEHKDKMVAIESFERNNLVLVDEGHRGAASGEGGVWLTARDTLCENGFSFEYSATFGQAVKGSKELTNRYAASIVFDYSYPRFHRDGFGKDYEILNLDERIETQERRQYLTAAVLAFYQQQLVFAECETELRPFLVEKPLWVFVGSSVTQTRWKEDGKTKSVLSTEDRTDVLEILDFIAKFASQKEISQRDIAQVLTKGIVVGQGKNLFAGRFDYLQTRYAEELDSGAIFADVLQRVFHAPAGGKLHVENLSGAQGEISLRIGAENQPFGLINVGDDAGVVKACKEAGIDVVEPEVGKGGGYFKDINRPQSPINLLIGARKFSEGWNSWRVSTFGLMNIGRNEGPQIIQLFGRGVRLRGYENSLRRSSALNLPDRPEHLQVLETLSIFGIRANYMRQFTEFLEDEKKDDAKPTSVIELPVSVNLPDRKLRTLTNPKRLGVSGSSKSVDFSLAYKRLAPVAYLRLPCSQPNSVEHKRFYDMPIVLNWYPRIDAKRSATTQRDDDAETLNTGTLGPQHLGFLDFTALERAAVDFKNSKGWHNLTIAPGSLAALLACPDGAWYRLLIPASDVALHDLRKVRVWQAVATSLIQLYIEKFYRFCKDQFEAPYMEYGYLDAADANFRGGPDGEGSAYYRIEVADGHDDLVKALESLKIAVARGEMKDWERNGLHTIGFAHHLFYPVLHKDAKKQHVSVTPVPIDASEFKFLQDLRDFVGANSQVMAGKELYALRNLSKAGLGFFEAGNFYPDFILWLLADGLQHIIFVDPKGLRQVAGVDPKIEFAKTIKDKEKLLAKHDPAVRLHSFIVSNTPLADVRKVFSKTTQELADSHVLFQKDHAESYIKQMVQAVLASK